MQYVYVLKSEKDGKFYTGCTHDLKKRIRKHSDGAVLSTRNRRPFKLLYYEAYLHPKDAFRREKYLKSTMGKRDLRNRLRESLTG